MNKEKLREEIAEQFHCQWMNWTKYFISKIEETAEMALIEYPHLTEGEKWASRNEADKFIALIEKHMEEEDGQ